MTDELLKALQLIKKECSEHSRCKDCPMKTSDNQCGLEREQPSCWSLEKREVYF